MKRFTSAAEFIQHFTEWAPELKMLHALIGQTELEETIKWGWPVYTINKKNVLGLSAFKSYVGLWFYQGVFLKDEKKVLMNAQEGKTKAMRQWRFKSIAEMDETLIMSYINEAIQNQKDGKVIKPEKKKDVPIPDELKTALSDNSRLKDSFEKLSAAKQRDYATYIGEAKRTSTRTSRMEKIIPLILDGKGVNHLFMRKK